MTIMGWSTREMLRRVDVAKARKELASIADGLMSSTTLLFHETYALSLHGWEKIAAFSERCAATRSLHDLAGSDASRPHGLLAGWESRWLVDRQACRRQTHHNLRWTALSLQVTE